MLKPIPIDFSDAAPGFKIKIMVQSLGYTAKGLHAMQENGVKYF